MKNKLWFWGAADKQDINVGIINFFDADARARSASDLIAAQKQQRTLAERGHLRQAGRRRRSA